jgi:hypothetical protein
MRYRNPKISAERTRLLFKLEMYEQRIQDDIDALKQSIQPLEVAKTVLNQAADSFRDNSLATQGMRLALTLAPRRFRHPVIGIAAQIGVPLLVRNLPEIMNFIARKTVGLKETTLGEKLSKIWGRLRD